MNAKGEGEKEKECTTGCESQGDGMRRPPGHLITRAGREEVMRKGGGEEVKSVRCMCDVCAAHGDLEFCGIHYFGIPPRIQRRILETLFF